MIQARTWGGESIVNAFFRRAFGSVAVLLFSVVAAGAASALDTDWKIGLAKVKITPTEPVFLSGYQARDHPFEKVTSDLYAKAMSLEDRDGKVAVRLPSLSPPGRRRGL